MKIILVDDHQLMIDGLLSILAEQHNITVVGVAKNGIQALALLEKNEVDVVLTDLSMPEMDGKELTVAVKKKYPAVKVIALSMHGDTTHIDELIEAGVSGYIYKNASNKELVEALIKVHQGGQYFSDEIAAAIVRSMNDHTKRKQEEEKVNLTAREKEIICLIAREFSNAKVATELFISERTVETHRKNIYRKTGTASVVGLIKWAYENKAIE